MMSQRSTVALTRVTPYDCNNVCVCMHDARKSTLQTVTMSILRDRSLFSNKPFDWRDNSSNAGRVRGWCQIKRTAPNGACVCRIIS